MIRSTPRREYDLFIAAPMSAVDSVDYDESRRNVLALMDRLSQFYEFGGIYFAGAAIGGPETFSGRGVALRQDVEALRNSRLFVLMYPRKIVTSALVEVGYALALGIPCLLLVNDRADLPFLLNQAETGVASDILPPLRIRTFRDPILAAGEVAAFRDDTRREERNSVG